LVRQFTIAIQEKVKTLSWIQRKVRIAPKPRGFHLITRELTDAVPEIAGIRVGLMHVFIQHTSASLSINENADPDVRVDMETAMNLIAREDMPFSHTCEGPDDMAAHVKTALLGCQLTIPISEGQLELGTWQGIYLCEHRNRAGSRSLVLTIMGEQSC
jgi:secondary thiamine-phosphate synthase enzyme